MSLLDILSTLFISPLKLVFETIFAQAYRISDDPAFSIIVLSLIMNILVLPLYRQADAMQERARQTDARLHKGVAHIKKTFSGDERMMILQTYYRQNNYRPTDALNGSVSLLLEIPFFMAAYQFLSHVQVLNGAALGPIQNLGAPDGLLVVGGLTLNLLPIAMTAINCISSALYLRGFPLKTKLQIYGMAMFFLVFLYDSPSGLVFYWTLNNLFSLVKNIFYKLKNPKKVLSVLGFILGAAVMAYDIYRYPNITIWRKMLLAGISLAMMSPLVCGMVRIRHPERVQKACMPVQGDRRLFLLGGLFLTVLTGALIPSSVIVSSPQEFVDTFAFYHPLWLVVGATTLAAGVFLVWLGVFYWLADAQWKVRFQKLMLALCGMMLVNYLFFGTNMGTLSSTLQFEAFPMFPKRDKLVNLIVVLAVGGLLYWGGGKIGRKVSPVLLTALIAVGYMSGNNMLQIRESVSISTSVNYDSDAHFPLSKTGKNVVVLMLDRAMGEYVPYLFGEKPELLEKFDGFTYYPNTISFGGFTNFSTPSLFGGYEYTPVEINKREDEPLVKKQNEALKVMPTLFADSGCKVTVCDPTYANYQWIPDLSIYDDDPRINAYITNGMFIGPEQQELMSQRASNRYRNFFSYSIMKTVPLATQKFIYNGGSYNHMMSEREAFGDDYQATQSASVATGFYSVFMNTYNVLARLSQLTSVTEEDGNTFLMMTNDTTHEPVLLKEPEYIPTFYVDNTAYDAAHGDRFTQNGRTLAMDTALQMSHYHANMAAMLRLAEWFDYLRENGVYDNTRIILVSDHGRHLAQLEDMVIDLPYTNVDKEFYLPLLMVKDFDSHGFTTSEEFMTDADVPTLAMAGMVENPVNPFTGKKINSDEKLAHEQFITLSRDYNVTENNGNTFLPSYWASVKGNPWEEDNWTFYDRECVLNRHAAP